MDTDFLTRAACFFGGGTQLAMALGEYRESRAIDFLCSSRATVRLLREQITDRSLGPLIRDNSKLDLVRDVRTDRDGIRTFFTVDAVRLKFEIVFESRIDLEGELDPALGVPVLSRKHAVAEKLLANADRGLDESTSARDLIDLAFAAVHFGKPIFMDGLTIAEQVYGSAVRRYLDASLAAFRNRSRAAACIESLGLSDSATLRKGLRLLRTWG